MPFREEWVQELTKTIVLFGLENKKKGSKLLITSATISAAFPFGHLIIGTVPVEIKKLYGLFLDEDNKNKNSHTFHMEKFWQAYYIDYIVFLLETQRRSDSSQS